MDKMDNSSEKLDVDAQQPLLGAKYISIERRTPHDTVFLIDDTPFRSAMPQPTHWSIAWSDLMMTMFILFLSLFIYKTANQDFINPDRMEVISGDTIPSLDADRFDNTGLPFSPTSPSLPIISGGTVSKTEAITLRKTDHDNRFPTIKDRSKPEKEVVEIPVEKDFPDIPEISSPSIVLENSGEKVRLPVTGRQMVSPRPLVAEKPRRTDRIQDIYRMSKQVLETNNLKQFAAIDLVPDKALRIILTGDLLFETSKAELSLESREKLEKIASAIHTIPYIINVVGHTDNVPISSSRYTSNWELSVSRASTVARFLIETTEMDPNQFIVSGYSSYRPLVPNTSAENRMKNRRVEIIISKRLPKPVQARTTTFN